MLNVLRDCADGLAAPRIARNTGNSTNCISAAPSANGGVVNDRLMSAFSKSIVVLDVRTRPKVIRLDFPSQASSRAKPTLCEMSDVLAQSKNHRSKILLMITGLMLALEPTSRHTAQGRGVGCR